MTPREDYAKMTVYCQKGCIMQAVLYTEARNNFKTLIGKVCDDYDEFIISTKDNKTAVLISYEEYSAMKETMYLLSSKANRDRLNDAVEQIDKLDYTMHTLES